MSDPSDGDDPAVPPAGTGTCHEPGDPPTDCPVCGDGYHSVTDHTGGLMVNLEPNERFDRVCFQPVGDGDEPKIRFFHH